MSNGTAATHSPALTSLSARPWAFVYLTALIFFGTADQVFATRLFSVNLRWAQLLLLGGTLASLPFVWQGWRARRTEVMRSLPLLVAWVAFFVAYGVAATVSEAPGRTVVKLAWGAFNVLGAATVCLLTARPAALLRDAFLTASVLVAAVIWVDALVLYWVGLEAPLLGLAQTSYVFEGQQVLRPHAFYYEPSYAGAWLAFGLPVVVLATWHRPRWMRLLLPAVVLGAIVLTSARTGIVSAAMAIGIAALHGLMRRDRALLGNLAATLAVTAVLLAVFFAPPRAASYGRFISGPLGPKALMARLMPAPVPDEPPPSPQPPPPVEEDSPAEPLVERIEKALGGPMPKTSEGNRLASYAHALKTWWQRPLLGWGVAASGPDDRLLPPVTINTWLEILVEAGLLGLLTFGGAIVLSVRTAVRHARATTLSLLGAAWLAHLLVNLNLTQTYPRLDYWLLFFLTIRLALPDVNQAAVSENETAARAA